MFENLAIYHNYGILFLRFALACIFIVHGWPKMKSPTGLAQALGWPKIFGFLHGLTEVLAALFIIAGIYIRQSSLVLGVIMLGAIYYKKFKWKTPFLSRQSTGWEFDLILLAICIFLLVGIY